MIQQHYAVTYLFALITPYDQTLWHCFYFHHTLSQFRFSEATGEALGTTQTFRVLATCWSTYIIEVNNTSPRCQLTAWDIFNNSRYNPTPPRISAEHTTVIEVHGLMSL